jgi:hypothetical protein
MMIKGIYRDLIVAAKEYFGIVWHCGTTASP